MTKSKCDHEVCNRDNVVGITEEEVQSVLDCAVVQGILTTDGEGNYQFAPEA